MHVVIGGASGFLGAPLAHHLRQRGHRVTALVRRTAGSDESWWKPSEGLIDQTLIDSCDAVVNLSGSPISQWPRTPARKREILASRLGATGTLARAIAAAPTPPAFLSGSGMSWYGVDRGDDELDETSGPGTGFLAEVAQQWEAAAAPAVDAGARVAYLRTSIVLDRSGGALKLMVLPFKLGLGARLGDGRQYFSTISRRDWVAAVTHVLEGDLSGPVNLAIPDDVTNRDFTRTLAATVRRPALLSAPAFAVRLALGGLADDLLGSLRLRPAALMADGFSFSDPGIDRVLRTALGRGA
ncbi:epimerase [Aeromicrobium flavum]|uniref:Epimerase n=1 Tax=Aeromicrobium flavum TaxID=416568 RepID=A0A512HQI8_9ACTN|nr:TIGR01777 family oxidoreductase [Aeromicrobium flavum]GEO87721.1 epimerase [Aeromicrobium flavum]